MSNDGIVEWIRDRRSEVSFSPSNLNDDIISKLFAAASMAPSAYNEQPWRFYVGDRKYNGSFEKIFNLLAPGNKEWAMNASLLVLTAANGVNSRNGNANQYAMHDLGMASFSLAVQAQSMGLVTHFMGGFDQNQARDILKIPASLLIGSVISIGYKGINDNLSPALLKRATSARVRKELTEFVTLVK